MLYLSRHGMAVTMPNERARVGASQANQLYRQAVELFDQTPVWQIVERPAVAEYALDPAFEQSWHRPPVNGVDQHQSIGAFDPRLFA